MPPTYLPRLLTLPGAILLGLGSMIGTGVFVSLGLATSIAGSGVIVAVVIAALVAACNGMSSAQLAASHPVSGGTYEYGYRYLTPTLGFLAGWTFLVAKSASAATAAIGCVGYLLTAFGIDTGYRAPIAVTIVLLFTALAAGGLQRSNRVNAVLVAVTLLSLLAFILLGAPSVEVDDLTVGRDIVTTGGLETIFHAAALLFVAYTGYGRVATLGEEVRDPRRTVPRAVIAVVVITMILYGAVALVALGDGGRAMTSAAVEGGAPLNASAESLGIGAIVPLLTVGAVTAMLGVLLNLLIGLSRVLLAMGRRGDMPARLARLNGAGTTPTAAVVAVGLGVAALTLLDDVMATWSLSAFAVLIYYGITNVAALRLDARERFVPRIVAVAGLAACLFLVVWIEERVMIAGAVVIVAGMIWRLGYRAFGQRPNRRTGP